MDRCVVCGDTVDVHQSGWYRQVIGWEQVRSQGGANKISIRQTTGQVMHFACMDKKRMTPGQGTMFE